MRAEVNEERCEGDRVCESAAPEIYRVDDHGHHELSVNDAPAERVGRARKRLRSRRYSCSTPDGSTRVGKQVATVKGWRKCRS